MGVVDSFKGAGLFAKIALGLLLIAALFVWIAYTCTGWGEATSGQNIGRHIGLWRSCSENEYNADCRQLDGWANDWFAITQALVTFGFFGINVALFLVILYIFVSSCEKNKEVGLAAAIVCIATGVLYLIGLFLFRFKFNEDYQTGFEANPNWGEWKLGYCFALSSVAWLLEVVAGVLMIRDTKQGGTSPSG